MPIHEFQSANGVNCFIRDKHDPRNLPSAFPGFRSVVSEDCASRPQVYNDHASASGTALYSVRHGSTGLFVRTPPYLSCGSAIPFGCAMPTTPMDGYYVAQAFTPQAHIFAENESSILSGISAGVYNFVP